MTDGSCTVSSGGIEGPPSANSTQGTAGANVATAALEEDVMKGWSEKLEVQHFNDVSHVDGLGHESSWSL
jgi:hypothetical protein